MTSPDPLPSKVMPSDFGISERDYSKYLRRSHPETALVWVGFLIVFGATGLALIVGQGVPWPIFLAMSLLGIGFYIAGGSAIALALAKLQYKAVPEDTRVAIMKYVATDRAAYAEYEAAFAELGLKIGRFHRVRDPNNMDAIIDSYSKLFARFDIQCAEFISERLLPLPRAEMTTFLRWLAFNEYVRNGDGKRLEIVSVNLVFNLPRFTPLSSGDVFNSPSRKLMNAFGAATEAGLNVDISSLASAVHNTSKAPDAAFAQELQRMAADEQAAHSAWMHAMKTLVDRTKEFDPHFLILSAAPPGS